MKIRKGILSILLLTLVFTACNQHKGKPEYVTEKYFTLYYQAEFEEIQQYVMEEHRSYYELLKDYFIPSGQDTTAKYQVKVTDIECDILEGDTVAVCSCSVQTDNDTIPREQSSIQLKKVGKIWLVNQGKEGSGLPSSKEMENIMPKEYQNGNGNAKPEE